MMGSGVRVPASALHGRTSQACAASATERRAPVVKLRRSITYANVCSTLALVIAISGGTAWAASRIGSRQLANGAVVGRVLATGSVTSRAVKNHSLLAVDFKRGQLPRGSVGPAGAGALMDASWTLAEGVNGSTTTSFARTRTLGAFSLASAAIVD